MAYVNTVMMVVGYVDTVVIVIFVIGPRPWLRLFTGGAQYQQDQRERAKRRLEAAQLDALKAEGELKDAEARLAEWKL
jgi:hypothetical protein